MPASETERASRLFRNHAACVPRLDLHHGPCLGDRTRRLVVVIPTQLTHAGLFYGSDSFEPVSRFISGPGSAVGMTGR